MKTTNLTIQSIDVKGDLNIFQNYSGTHIRVNGIQYSQTGSKGSLQDALMWFEAFLSFTDWKGFMLIREIINHPVDRVGNYYLIYEKRS